MEHEKKNKKNQKRTPTTTTENKKKQPNKQQQHKTTKPSAVAPELVTLDYSLAHVTDVEHSTLPQLSQFILD